MIEESSLNQNEQNKPPVNFEDWSPYQTQNP